MLKRDGDSIRVVSELAEWCDNNNLLLNVTKTKEMVIDFKTNKSPIEPLTINGKEVEQVEVFKFLGCNISNKLQWSEQISENFKKWQQRMFFLRRLKSFNVSIAVLISFYRASIESISTTSILVWFSSATSSDIKKLNRVVRTASYIIGREMDKL